FFPNQDDLAHLIHHRGYTHSFLFTIPLGLAVGAIANRVFKRPWNDRLGLCVGAGAGLLHIAADWLNSYGVHPLTPFLNRWYYGDFVFIVEPLLWFTLIPVAILTVQKLWSKTVWGGILAAFVTSFWLIPWLSRPFALFLTL